VTFLELVRELQLKGGVAGPTIVTTVGQTGLTNRLVGFITNAWQEIQLMRNDWLFMKTEASKVLVVGQSLYGVQLDWGLTDVRKFDPKDWRIENLLITNDKAFMGVLSYPRWREKYGANIGPSNARPSELTEIYNAAAYPSQKAIQFNAMPDLAYQVTFSYEKIATILSADVSPTADAQVPSMPADYHMAIVWKALEYYGYYESAGEVIAQAQRQFAVLNRAMTSTQTLYETEVQPCPLA